MIRTISEKREHVVFMLWGAYAQGKEWMIDRDKHLVLTAPHPSPLSAHRGFFGCKHFSKANEYLKKKRTGGSEVGLITSKSPPDYSGPVPTFGDCDGCIGVFYLMCVRYG